MFLPQVCDWICAFTERFSMSLSLPLSFLVEARIDRFGVDLNPTEVVNKSLTLECPVYGVPTPVIKWYKEGARLDVDDRQHIYTTDDGKKDF